MTDPLPPDWTSWRDRFDVDGYEERWQRLAAAGVDPHGEVALVQTYEPRSVLDAGCGTGRVAIELAHRGVAVVGIDNDPDMVDVARAKAPELRWIVADLADLAELARRRAAWSAPAPKHSRGVLAKYAKLVGTAARGAVCD